jgi:hypothetical protein
MMEHKFTDDEIVKALDCKAEAHCAVCDTKECVPCEWCVFHYIKHALDLINRQKAEIERLQDEHDGRIKSLAAAFKIAEAEERCKAYILSQKAEAIKEFARRLTNTIMGKLDASDNAPDGDFYFITDVYEDIDNLEKEMTEVKK